VLAGAGDGVHHDLRQACAYGLGVCAQHCPDRFRPKAPEAVAALVASVRAPGSRTEDAADATDNAVSALGKAVEFCGDAFDSAPVLQLWLDYLPVRADTAEAQAVHAQLCRFMQAGDARLLGAANERLPRVIAVFADCLAAGDPLITAATAENMRSLLRRMQAAMPAEQLGAAWAQLSAEQQAALSAALATTGAPA
jgi:ferredoxin